MINLVGRRAGALQWANISGNRLSVQAKTAEKSEPWQDPWVIFPAKKSRSRKKSKKPVAFAADMGDIPPRSGDGAR
jgi:hypothetical protein